MEASELMTSAKADPKGRAIDPVPVLSLLLEPRSLIITSGELYASHLHGIDAISEDILVSQSAVRPSSLFFSNTPI
jgi:alkylated DNA repair protein alkB family protein 6